MSPSCLTHAVSIISILQVEWQACRESNSPSWDHAKTLEIQFQWVLAITFFMPISLAAVLRAPTVRNQVLIYIVCIIIYNYIHLNLDKSGKKKVMFFPGGQGWTISGSREKKLKKKGVEKKKSLWKKQGFFLYWQMRTKWKFVCLLCKVIPQRWT